MNPKAFAALLEGIAEAGGTPALNAFTREMAREIKRERRQIEKANQYSKSPDWKDVKAKKNGEKETRMDYKELGKKIGAGMAPKLTDEHKNIMAFGMIPKELIDLAERIIREKVPSIDSTGILQFQQGFTKGLRSAAKTVV